MLVETPRAARISSSSDDAFAVCARDGPTVVSGRRWRAVAAAGRDEKEKKTTRGVSCVTKGEAVDVRKIRWTCLRLVKTKKLVTFHIRERDADGRPAVSVTTVHPHRVHSSRVEKRKAQGGRGGGRGGVTYLVGLCARPDGCGEALLRRRDANVLHLLEQLKCSLPLPGGPARFHLNGQNTMTPSG